MALLLTFYEHQLKNKFRRNKKNQFYLEIIDKTKINSIISLKNM